MVLQIMIDKLQLCQRALGPQYLDEEKLRTAVIKACRGVPELKWALFNLSKRCEELFSDLRSSIETFLDQPTNQYTIEYQADANDQEDQYYLDRRYKEMRFKGRGHNRGGFRGDLRGHNWRGNSNNSRDKRNNWSKKYFICRKEGCWSSKHSEEERQNARAQYLANCHFTGASAENFGAYLTEFEGNEIDCAEDFKEEDGKETNEAAIYLKNQAFLHRLTVDDIFQDVGKEVYPASQFVFDRYSAGTFQGILPDTGAARVSTAGKSQYLALKREMPESLVDKSTAGQATIQFGQGSCNKSIGTVSINTPVGEILFHVLNTPTPFLLCLVDMDRLAVYLENTTNQLAKKIKVVDRSPCQLSESGDIIGSF